LLRDLSYWLRDTAYMKTCTTGPSSRPEQETLRAALAFRGIGADRPTAEYCLLVARYALDNAPSVAKTKELIARAYQEDGAEWLGLIAFLNGGAAQ
jgi:hypothetical protein